jgi:hypothetical protein
MSNTFKSYPVKNIATTGNLVYTVPAATQTIGVGLSISNTSISPITANVYVNRSGTNYYIVNGATVASGQTLVAAGVDQKLVLQASDAVYVSTSANVAADCWFSILEIA